MGTGYTVGRSVETVPREQFCRQCGCCPTLTVPAYGSVMKTQGIETLPAGAELTSTDATLTEGTLAFDGQGSLQLLFTDLLDLTDPAQPIEAMGFYFKARNAYSEDGDALTVEIVLTGCTVYAPEDPLAFPITPIGRTGPVGPTTPSGPSGPAGGGKTGEDVGTGPITGATESITWDPTTVRTNSVFTGHFGIILGLKDVTCIEQVTLSFSTAKPGLQEIEFCGVAFLDLDPDQIHESELLVADTFIHLDAGSDVVDWQQSFVLQPPAPFLAINEVPEAIDGVSSLEISGTVFDPLEFLAAEQFFSSPLDLAGQDFLRVWVWAGLDQIGSQFVLHAEDPFAGPHTFPQVVLQNGWQQIDYDLAGLGINVVVFLAAGINNLLPGDHRFRLDTVRGGVLADAPNRTEELLNQNISPS